MKRVLAPALVAAFVLTGCSLVGGGGGGYTVTATFTRAVALYEGSQVQVMGANIGTVEDVSVDGDTIRVELSVHDDVPLPADVRAAIVPLTLVGERNIVLFPAWQPGDDRLADGADIPVERTVVPVEPDEALEAFTDLARAVDPDAVSRLVSSSADSLNGHGDDLNAALESSANLTGLLASEGDDLVSVAGDLQQLTSTLGTREEQLGHLLDSFAAATGVLADERESIRTFLSAVVELTSEGELLLEHVDQQLPQDVATLSDVAMVLRVNVDSLSQLVQALPANSRMVVNAWDPARRLLRIRVNLSPAAASALSAALAPLGLAPCVPGPGVDCG
jgi:phospholipid/cholesterol/gamma-HCH transport system substrate-binding protein